MNGKKMCILKVRCRKKMKFGKPLTSRVWAYVGKGDKSAGKKPTPLVFALIVEAAHLQGQKHPQGSPSRRAKLRFVTIKTMHPQRIPPTYPLFVVATIPRKHVEFHHQQDGQPTASPQPRINQTSETGGKVCCFCALL